MKVLVGVKRVVDYAVKVRIQPDKAGRLQFHVVSTRPGSERCTLEHSSAAILKQ